MNIKLHSLLQILVVFIWMPSLGYAQSSLTVGSEVQAYPAGVILGLKGGLDIGRLQELNLQVGYNITRRGDFGEHDNEEGGGPGLGMGYQYYFTNVLKGLFLGTQIDFWFMNIDWRDFTDSDISPIDPPGAQPSQVEGETDIIVLQPTIEVGYNLLKKSPDWLLAPTASFGFEINVKTEGEEVGEGAILLGGLQIGYKF